MKKTTNFCKYLAVLFFGLIFTGGVFAGNISVTENGSNDLKLTENSYSLINITNTLADIDFMRVKTKEGYFTLFSVNNYGYSLDEGSPKLPVIKKLIEVPLNATFDVEILSQNFQEIDLNEYGITDFVMPAQPPLSKNIDNPEDEIFVFDQTAYMRNTFIGPEMINIVDLGIVRGVRMARVEIAPVYYNPVQNKIKVFTDIQVKVNFKNGNIGATVAEKENKFSPFYEAIFNQFINYKPVEGKELILDEPVTYIIVSDPMFQDALEPFVAWKTKKGFQVVEAYTDNPDVGTTTTSIKSYLEDFYNNPPEGYNPQSFVLIVGDIAQVPTFNGTSSSHVSDLYYCTYDGSGDIYPECYYGRFSANNLTELQPQIDKTLEYEQYLFPDASFLDEVVMVAGADASHALTWGNGQINYGTEYYFNAAHGLYSNTYLQPEPGGANYSQSIRGDISEGVTYVNYSAHCGPSGWSDPSFNISHIGQLTNANKYPLIIGNCCSSVEFQITCFGEEILRAENKGALGYIGGSNSTYWDEDFWWGVGFESISANPVYNPSNLGAYDRTFHDNGEILDEWYVTQGQMLSAGNMAVTQAGSSLITYYWEIYHLMGDPSLMVYFSQPPETTANYQGLMPLASSSFTVNTDPYGYVAISKEGVLHGVGIADEAGMAEVTMYDPIVVPGDADVTITGQNLKPFFGTVTVASPNGAYVLMDDYTIDDSNGNGNGIADFDEYIMLNVTLENLGSQTASNVVATISTSDEFIIMESDNHDWPDIGAGSTATQAGAFAFTVADIIPDQHTAQFDIEITDGTDVWTGTFNVTLSAPVLAVGSYTIDDSNGNNNGRLDPGENANVIISNWNDGSCDAMNSMAAMVSTNPLLTINNASFDLETIVAGESKDAVFNVTADANAIIGEVISTSYTLTSEPYIANAMVSFTIGLVVEDFETGNFDAFPWMFLGNADWVIDDTDPYEGNYAAKTGTISDEQVTSMLVTAEVATDDVLSFYYKVSSETNYDYLKFYIDDIQQDEWSGEVSWSQAEYDVTAGEHTFKWEYYKDYSVSNGSDCAWVDFIVFPAVAGAAPLAVIASAVPAEVCEGESSQLNAFAMGGSGDYNYEWTPEEGLSDPNIANPEATPEETTTYYVIVSDGDGFVTGETTVTVNPLPEQPTISQSGNALVSSSANGNQWYDANGMIPGATGQNYTPTATDDYYVIVTNQFGCESEASESYYFIYTGLIELAEGQQVNIYPNPFIDRFTLDYSLVATSNVKVTIFNSFGQLLAVIEDESAKVAGNHRINFNAGDFKTGIYFLKIETSDYSVLKRIIHSK